jgi:hypothetical protein
MVTIDIKLGLCCSILSFGFFVVCRYLLRPLLVIRQTTEKPLKVSNPYIRTCFTYSNVEQWERLNLLASWIHSLITGLSTLYCFWTYSPDIYQDFVNHLSLVTYLTCSFSFGMLNR